MKMYSPNCADFHGILYTTNLSLKLLQSVDTNVMMKTGEYKTNCELSESWGQGCRIRHLQYSGIYDDIRTLSISFMHWLVLRS